MLAPYALALIGLAVVVTSFISGMFGMAGGMLLLGLLLLFMDVAPAMLLFASIHLAANSWGVANRYIPAGCGQAYLAKRPPYLLRMPAPALDQRDESGHHRPLAGRD